MSLGQWVLRWRWPIVVVGLCLLSGSAALTTKLEFNYSFWTLFVSDDPEVVKQVAYTEQWGEDSALLLLGLRSKTGKVMTVENLRLVDRIESDIEKIDGIEEVSSVLSTSTVRAEGDDLIIGPLSQGPPADATEAATLARLAQGNRLLAGNLVSENGRMTMIVARIERRLRNAADRNPVVEAIDKLSKSATEDTDLEGFLTGIPVAQWVYSAQMLTDMQLFTACSGVLLSIILLIMFRSLTGLILPLGVVATATCMTMATMVLTNEPINMLNTAIPTLMMVIGIADSIHLLADYRQRLAQGDNVEQAVLHTFRHLGWACFLTSLTTAVGFASLMVARIVTVKNFGLYSAIGIGYAFLANVLIIPVGLFLLKPKAGYQRSEAKDSLMHRALARLSAFTSQRPYIALALSGCLVVLVGSGLLQVKIESRMFEEMTEDDPVVVAHRQVEADLPGIVSYALDVTTEPGGVLEPELLAKLEALSRKAEAHPAVDRAMGLPDLLKEMNRAMHAGADSAWVVPKESATIAQYVMLAEGETTRRLLDDEASRTQVWMRGPETVTSVWEDLRGQLEAEIASWKLEGVEVVVTGASSMAQRALGAIVRDVLTSLVGASLIIFLVMSLLFRSAKVGLLSMIPNLIPLLMTVGVMGWLDINLRTSTVVIFSISLGLAVDDTIHFMVRYGRQRQMGQGAAEAVEQTMHLTGRPIVYTSLLLMGGFWILLFSSFNATRDIGLLGGVTLLSALFADLVILPALLVLMPSIGAGRQK